MNGFYQSEIGKQFMKETQNGKFAFIWAVKNQDGTEALQFDKELFHALLTDPHLQPGDLDLYRTSVDRLDVRQVKEFILFPTAYTQSLFFHLEPIRLVVDLEAGEKFISYWETDFVPVTGSTFTRHVLGISKPVNGSQAKFFVVVNPNGKTTITTKVDMSYDGE